MRQRYYAARAATTGPARAEQIPSWQRGLEGGMLSLRMATVTIAPTGVLQIDGTDVFPIGFSNPPPLGKQAPSGKEGLAELKAGGASFIRTRPAQWKLQ